MRWSARACPLLDTTWKTTHISTCNVDVNNSRVSQPQPHGQVGDTEGVGGCVAPLSTSASTSASSFRRLGPRSTTLVCRSRVCLWRCLAVQTAMLALFLGARAARDRPVPRCQKERGPGDVRSTRDSAVVEVVK